MGLRIITAPTIALLRSDTTARDEVIPVGVKPTVMLALLSAAGERGISRRALRDLLWEGTSDANAANSLRQSVFRVRRAIGADTVADAAGRLFLRTPIVVDVLEADRLLSADRLPEALELLPGPIGGCLDIAGTALRNWIRELRSRVERQLLAALSDGWIDAARSPVPGLFTHTLTRARQVLGDPPELLWLQLEVAATLNDSGAFEQVAARLAAPAGADRGEIAARTATLRSRLRLDGEEGGGASGRPIHEDALRALQQAWLGARAGRVSVAGLVGAPGTGRSWLLRELSRGCLAEGGRTIPLVAIRSSTEIPSACLRDIAVALAGHRGAAGVHPEFSETIARLREGVLSPPTDAVTAVHDLLTAVAVEGPLLVTLDDAHHYDARVLGRLLRKLRESPVAGLLVVPVLHSAPGEEIPSIAIGPTGPEGIRTLLSAMARLPRADWVTPLVAALHRAGDGRPGGAAQAILRLHREGLLRVIDDRWHLGSSLTTALNALTPSAV